MLEFKYYEITAKGHMTMHKLYLDPFMDVMSSISYGIETPFSKMLWCIGTGYWNNIRLQIQNFPLRSRLGLQMKAYTLIVLEERIFKYVS